MKDERQKMINDKETFTDRIFHVKCGMLWKPIKWQRLYTQHDLKGEDDIPIKN